jgi:transmembrane sensor
VADSNRSRDVAASEAVDWFLRQQEPGFGASDRQALAEWLLQAPLNVEEYLAISQVWGGLGEVVAPAIDKQSLVAAAKAELATGNVVPLRAPVAVADGTVGPPVAGPTRVRGWRYAAALLLGGGVVALILQAGRGDVVYSTALGEQRIVALADGSVLMLNTDSRVRVALKAHQRDIDLLRGEGRFQVAKDPTRPFVVRTNGAEVRALGTIFNVRFDSGRTQVAVIEGQVVVRSTGTVGSAADTRQHDVRTSGAGAVLRQVVLAAGERAVAAADAVAVGVGQPLESAIAWTERKLVFRDATLGSVIDEFNRYRLHPLRLDDAELGSLRISGVFAIEDPEALLIYLKGFEKIDIRQGEDGTDHLVRARTN